MKKIFLILLSLHVLATPLFCQPEELPLEGQQMLLQGLAALKVQHLAEAQVIANALYERYPRAVDSYRLLVNVSFAAREYELIPIVVRTAESYGIRDSELYHSAAAAAYLLGGLKMAISLLADYEEMESERIHSQDKSDD